PHRVLFSHYPLAQLAVAFAAGICAGSYSSVGLWLVATGLCSALAVLCLLKERLRIAGPLLLLAIFFTGAVSAELERRSDNASGVRSLVEQADGKSLTLTGWLDQPPEYARDRVYLSLRVENVTGRVSLLVPLREANEFDSLQLRYGARISVTTTLDRTG